MCIFYMHEVSKPSTVGHTGLFVPYPQARSQNPRAWQCSSALPHMPINAISLMTDASIACLQDCNCTHAVVMQCSAPLTERVLETALLLFIALALCVAIVGKRGRCQVHDLCPGRWERGGADESTNVIKSDTRRRVAIKALWVQNMSSYIWDTNDCIMHALMQIVRAGNFQEDWGLI